MPLYDYQCACGKQFEAYCPLNENSDTANCDCGGQARKVFINAPALSSVGRQKGPGCGAGQVNFNKPDVLKETMLQAHALESAGMMNKTRERHFRQIIGGLKRRQAKGELKTGLDYQVHGHPVHDNRK
jgi:putative FmdB family regulatory protein